MKRILVLGTGDAQVDFIKLCKEKDIEVHSCSHKPEGRGIRESDYFSIINITNSQSIIDYIKKEGINLVGSTGSDLAMCSSAIVSEQLSFPTLINSEIAKICNKKAELRKKLINLSEYSVLYKELQKKSDLPSWNLFPAMVKPNDSQGQRGITKVYDSSALKSAYDLARTHSRSGSVIVEEFVDGKEISINVYLVNGEIKFQIITERISFMEYPGGIIKKHLYPVLFDLNMEEINKMIHSLLKYLEIKNGPVYMQVKISQSGKPKIIELTPRLDGCHLWRLIFELKGINLLDIFIEHLINGNVNDEAFHSTLKIVSKNAELSFFTSKPDTTFRKSDYLPDKSAVYNEWYYNDGDMIRTINGYQEKVGYQIVVDR